MRALITGAGGQLASELEALLGPAVHACARGQLDITDQRAVQRVVDDVQPDVIFNCAAFHNVDVCETEPARAWQVNVEAVRELAMLPAKLVHVSTNYVFDGRREQPYGEDDRPAPRSAYAISKLAGEHAALAYGDDSLVIRAAGLYGLHGSASKGGNFVQRMIRRADEQGSLAVVADQRLQPTFTRDLASAMLAAVEAQASGTVHLTASGQCSWYEFTQAILDRAGIDVPLAPSSTTPSAGSADRPRNGVLARPRADRLGLPVLRHWSEGLADYMDQAGLTATASL